MATNRDLLKEAIADAKAVKETAIANAKAALEEAFTPFLKEKLAAKINEIDEADEMMNTDKMYTEAENENENAMMEMEEDMLDEVSLDELLAELEEEGENLSGAKGDMSKKINLYKQQLLKSGVNPKSFMMWMMKGINSFEDYSNMSLEDMIEADIEFNEGESGKEVDAAFVKDILDTHIPMFKEEGENLSEAKGDTEEEMSIEDMSEEDLKSFIEDVIKDMVAAGELEAGEEGEEMEDEEEGEEIEAEEEEEVDLEELLAEEEIMGETQLNESAIQSVIDAFNNFGQYVTPESFATSMAMVLTGIGGLAAINWKEELAAAAKKGKDAVIAKVKELAGKKGPQDEAKKVEREVKTEDLEEAYSTIKTLKSELHEINLLNAKLLYTNKIFRNKSLTESQKIKVLTAFDKATSKKEVELVYETLQESLKVSTTKAPIKESLGSASKVLGNASAKPIIEVDNQFARWQQLAGIKK